MVQKSLQNKSETSHNNKARNVMDCSNNNQWIDVVSHLVGELIFIRTVHGKDYEGICEAFNPSLEEGGKGELIVNLTQLLENEPENGMRPPLEKPPNKPPAVVQDQASSKSNKKKSKAKQKEAAKKAAEQQQQPLEAVPVISADRSQSDVSLLKTANRSDVSQKMRFEFDDIVELACSIYSISSGPSLPSSTETAASSSSFGGTEQKSTKSGFTDKEISGHGGVEEKDDSKEGEEECRLLEKWNPDDGDSFTASPDGAEGSKSSLTDHWAPEAMFETNEALIEGRSTYQPNMPQYSTAEVPHDDGSEAHLRRRQQAELIAREIQSNTNSQYHSTLENVDVERNLDEASDGNRSRLPSANTDRGNHHGSSYVVKDASNDVNWRDHAPGNEKGSSHRGGKSGHLTFRPSSSSVNHHRMNYSNNFNSNPNTNPVNSSSRENHDHSQYRPSANNHYHNRGGPRTSPGPHHRGTSSVLNRFNGGRKSVHRNSQNATYHNNASPRMLHSANTTGGGGAHYTAVADKGSSYSTAVNKLNYNQVVVNASDLTGTRDEKKSVTAGGDTINAAFSASAVADGVDGNSVVDGIQQQQQSSHKHHQQPRSQSHQAYQHSSNDVRSLQSSGQTFAKNFNEPNDGLKPFSHAPPSSARFSHPEAPRHRKTSVEGLRQWQATFHLSSETTNKVRNSRSNSITSTNALMGSSNNNRPPMTYAAKANYYNSAYVGVVKPIGVGNVSNIDTNTSKDQQPVIDQSAFPPLSTKKKAPPRASDFLYRLNQEAPDTPPYESSGPRPLRYQSFGSQSLSADDLEQLGNVSTAEVIGNRDGVAGEEEADRLNNSKNNLQPTPPTRIWSDSATANLPTTTQNQSIVSNQPLDPSLAGAGVQQLPIQHQQLQPPNDRHDKTPGSSNNKRNGNQYSATSSVTGSNRQNYHAQDTNNSGIVEETPGNSRNFKLNPAAPVFTPRTVSQPSTPITPNRNTNGNNESGVNNNNNDNNENGNGNGMNTNNDDVNDSSWVPPNNPYAQNLSVVMSAAMSSNQNNRRSQYRRPQASSAVNYNTNNHRPGATNSSSSELQQQPMNNPPTMIMSNDNNTNNNYNEGGESSNGPMYDEHDPQSRMLVAHSGVIIQPNRNAGSARNSANNTGPNDGVVLRMNVPISTTPQPPPVLYANTPPPLQTPEITTGGAVRPSNPNQPNPSPMMGSNIQLQPQRYPPSFPLRQQHQQHQHPQSQPRPSRPPLLPSVGLMHPPGSAGSFADSPSGNIQMNAGFARQHSHQGSVHSESTPNSVKGTSFGEMGNTIGKRMILPGNGGIATVMLRPNLAGTAGGGNSGGKRGSVMVHTPSTSPSPYLIQQQQQSNFIANRNVQYSASTPNGMQQGPADNNNINDGMNVAMNPNNPMKTFFAGPSPGIAFAQNGMMIGNNPNMIPNNPNNPNMIPQMLMPNGMIMAAPQPPPPGSTQTVLMVANTPNGPQQFLATLPAGAASLPPSFGFMPQQQGGMIPQVANGMPQPFPPAGMLAPPHAPTILQNPFSNQIQQPVGGLVRSGNEGGEMMNGGNVGSEWMIPMSSGPVPSSSAFVPSLQQSIPIPSSFPTNSGQQQFMNNHQQQQQQQFFTPQQTSSSGHPNHQPYPYQFMPQQPPNINNNNNNMLMANNNVLMPPSIAATGNISSTNLVNVSADSSFYRIQQQGGQMPSGQVVPPGSGDGNNFGRGHEDQHHNQQQQSVLHHSLSVQHFPKSSSYNHRQHQSSVIGNNNSVTIAPIGSSTLNGNINPISLPHSISSPDIPKNYELNNNNAGGNHQNQAN